MSVPLLLYTIGHSNRGEAELIGLLREHAVVRLVDVRTAPKSRAHPQWWKERMEVSLPA